MPPYCSPATRFWYEPGARRPSHARASAEFLRQKRTRWWPYGVRRDDEIIDYEELARLADEHKPKLIIAGASAYSRIIDFAKFRAAADACGALLLVDMAHFSGLVAAGLYPNPCEWADIVTSTTHKTLRGPRSGIILSKAKYAAAIDKVVFPAPGRSAGARHRGQSGVFPGSHETRIRRDQNASWSTPKFWPTR